jgi:hypothetical protein
MDLLFPDTGLIYLLKKAVGSFLIYDLFINDFTPTLDSSLPDFNRAVWSGYAPIQVPLVSWTTENVSAHLGTLAAADILFFNTSPSPVTVYGYYVKDSTDTILVATARFDLAPITIPVGGNLPVTPLLGSYSGLSQ